MENILKAIQLIKESEINSKVVGRRNWVIITRNNYATLWGWGVAKRRNLLSARMSEVAEYNISWFEYTYKADALKMLNTLKGIGYTTNIGNMG